jgi:leucyl aminopeptidase
MTVSKFTHDTEVHHSRQGSQTADLASTSLTAIKADLLVVPVFGERLDSEEIRALDAATGSLLGDEVSRQGFTGKIESTFLYQTHGSLPARNILLAGSGAATQPSTWYQLADTVARTSHQLKASAVVVEPTREAPPFAHRVIAEGFALSRYRFVRYRSGQDDEPTPALVLRVSSASAKRQGDLMRADIAAKATCYARDLVNTPAAELTPTTLAREARRLTRLGLTVKVYDKPAIERLGMGGLLGVARGSGEPPRFIEILYRPDARPRARIALVGKGITFDSGGLSLKTPDSMRIQKRDMAGGASVLATMSALPALRLPIEVRGYVPAAENMPGGRALKPGDVVTAFNGKTIEVLNTDAEGRLLLADALAYAASRRPDLIIDFATLTAAVHNALGSRYAAILGTDRNLIADCIAAGAEVDERLWELPLVPEYRRDIDSPVADLKNIGEGQASTIIGALFLREFTGDVPWAHVDFASTGFSSGFPCHPVGATGFGVRTMLQYLLRR